LFKKSRLKQAGISPELISQYVDQADLLPNLQLLSGLPNVEKLAKLPAEWLAGPHFPSAKQREHYLNENDLAQLPLDLDKFLEFYQGRRQRIETRLKVALAGQVRTVEPLQTGPAIASAS
jgi:hypothetical protein